YHDVSSINDKIFALGKFYTVQVWNSDGAKVTTLESFEPGPSPIRYLIGRDYCSPRFYFVAPLLIVRIVGECVNEAGEFIEAEVETDEDFPYRTLEFEVFVMDKGVKNWVKKKSLGENRAVFLGEGHSISVPAIGGITADCIYYSDDYWERMDDDPSYGGNDLGVFNLRDGKIKKLGHGLTEIEPPPSWIVPSPW
ncbi:hypothetical protein LINPERHAP2_LOCUS14487, partial [Linum perenne]